MACPNICIDWFWYCNIARNDMFLLWFESMIPMDLGILWEGTWHCLTPNNDAPNAHKSKVCWLKHALIYRHLLFRSIIGMIWLHRSLYQLNRLIQKVKLNLPSQEIFDHSGSRGQTYQIHPMSQVTSRYKAPRGDISGNMPTKIWPRIMVQ